MVLGESLGWEEAMKPAVGCLFVVAGMLTAGTAFAQDFKSQATATASP